MPLYLYRCSTCGQVLEQFRPVSHRDVAPNCPATVRWLSLPLEPMERVITTPAIRGETVARS